MSEKKFNYVYTAPTEEERREIASIRKQYASGEENTESKMDRLRRLDSAVKNTALIISLCLGVIGCLIFGLGLTMILLWGIWWGGIPVATVGTAGMVVAYPAYQKVLRKGKEKYGAEILKLSEELLQGE